jgi:hypothetical protein
MVALNPPPTVTLNSVTPITCTGAVNHTISADILVGSGTFSASSDAILFSYSYDGTTYTSTSMTNTTGNTYTATIPAATPINATVLWSISATNSFNLNATISGSYQDSPISAYTLTTVALPSTLCIGESTQLSAVITPSASYTDAPVLSDEDEDIGNVTIISGVDTLLNNTSVYQSLVGSVGAATGTPGLYANYSELTNIPMVAGSTYGFAISSIDVPTYYNNSLAIFIDFNKDGDFVDAGEMVFQPSATINGPHTRTGTFTVPSWAFGTMRMRVVCLEALIDNYSTNSSWGEREDYTLSLIHI